MKSVPTDNFRSLIRTIPDWPTAGIQFRDITPLLQDGPAFHALIEVFAGRYAGKPIHAIAGIEARGFIIGAALACRLGCGFIPVRKSGKLPYRTLSETNALEYGTATLEVHADALQPGAPVLLIDDLLATGGTIIAAANLLQALGARIIEAATIIDLPTLGGSRRLQEAGITCFSLLDY